MTAVRHRATLARENAGLSAGQAAKLLSVERGELVRLEACEPLPAWYAAKLADIYGVSIEWLNGTASQHDYVRVDAIPGADKLTAVDRDAIAEVLASKPRRPVVNDLVSGTFRHCDDYIDDDATPAVLRAFLERARSPGHGMTSRDPFPKLFATYVGEGWKDVSKGDRVRVVMASRLGDVGVTKNHAAESGYSVRCAVDSLSDFGDAP